MKHIALLLLLLSLPAALFAQQPQTAPAPDIFISANASNPNLYAGWPLIVDVTIMNTNRLNRTGPSASLVIAPPNAVWTDSITISVVSSAGDALAWPLQLVGTAASPTLTLGRNSYVRAKWQMAAADVSALPPGTYQIMATIEVSNSAAWNGTVQSSPFSITIAPEPVLTPDLQAEKAYRQTEFAINTGDATTAVTVTQQLRLAQPDNPIAATAAANVLQAAGYPELAFLQASNALDTFYRVNPTPLEAPSNLLATYQQLFATISAPGTTASTSISASSLSLVFSPNDQAASLAANVSTSIGSANGGTVTFTVVGIGSAISSPVTGGSASAVLTIPGGTHAGTYVIQTVYSGTPEFTGSTDSGAALVIAKATPVVTWNTPGNIAPGASLGPNQLNATANIPGAFVYNPPAGTVLAPGVGQALTVNFTPNDAVDYNSQSATVSINVIQANLTITANSASRQYGQANPAFTASFTGFVNGDTISSLSGSLSCLSAASPSSPVSGGPYPINCSGVSSVAYTITFVPGALFVTPAPLTITASDATRAYGAANPPLNNVSASGFVTGDLLSSLAGTLSCTTIATPTSTAGSYPILCTGLSSPNYSITYFPGTLRITSDTLTITANNAARQYGSANPAFTATFAGFANGDTPASLVGSLACTTAATSASSVGGGPYPINCSGLNSSSYAISYVPGALTITSAPLVIAANNASRPYGANNPAFTGTVTGLLNSDPISATFLSAAVPASPVATYPILPTVIAAPSVLSNYAVALVNGTLSVAQERTSLSLTLSPTSIVQGQSSTITVTLSAPDMAIPIDPSVLAAVTVSSPVSSDSFTNNGVCIPLPSTMPGAAGCIITITASEPNGRILDASFAGTSALAPSSGTGELIVTTPITGTTTCIASDFKNIPVAARDAIWFSSIFRVHDVTRQKITLSFSQSSVKFQYRDAGQNLISVNQAMPDGKIVIDPNVRNASITFDPVQNAWITTLPFDTDDAGFLTGAPWLVPAGGIPGDIEPVTWCGTFASDTPGMNIGWHWAAAAYSSFSSNDAVLGVKPMDTDRDNPGYNEDRAGTPENFKRFVVPGARGKGGKNYTGTFTRSSHID